MAAVEKYQLICEEFLKKLAEDDVEIRASGGGHYVYRDGAWSLMSIDDKADLNSVLVKICDEHNFAFGEKEGAIWKYLTAIIPKVRADEMNVSGMIALRNGTLDPYTGELHPHDPEHYTTRSVDVEFNPHAKCPQWLAMLNRMVSDKSDEEAEETIEFLQIFFGLAIAGYSRFNDRRFRKMVLMVGPPRTAKSTCADVLRRLIGPQHCASENLDQIGSRFGLSGVLHAQAIVADDAIHETKKADPNTLKCLITGEPLVADRKNLSPVSFRFHGPILVTGNDLPRFDESSSAVYDRTVVLRFSRQFSRDDAKELLGSARNVMDFLERENEFPGILNWALAGLDKAAVSEGLPNIAAADDVSDSWRAENDPMFAFFRDCCEVDPDVATQVRAVGFAMSVYAEEFSKRYDYPPNRCILIASRIVSEALPVYTSKPRQIRLDGYGDSLQRVLDGIRLNERGEALAARARNKFGIREKWFINDPEIAGRKRATKVKLPHGNPAETEKPAKSGKNVEKAKLVPGKGRRKRRSVDTVASRV